MMTMSSSSSVTNSVSSNHWKTLDVNQFPNLTSNGCRFAKDEQYLKSVLDLWKQEEGKIRKDKLSQLVETSPWTYYDDDQTPLYGHIVKPIIDSSAVEKDIRNDNGNKDNDNDSSRPLYPGILMFHTAAGPQDVFLFQKAAQLASSELQCVVLICDILSDPCGWAWSPDGDRTRYNQVRQRLLQDNGRLMRSRVNASVQTLIGDVDNNFDFGVDPNRLAGMGWCLGAQPILELLTLNSKESTRFSVDALISFHGVFRRDPLPLSEQSLSSSSSSSSLDEKSSRTGRTRDVLICNGKCDPFVSQDDIDITKRSMEEKMYNVTVLDFDGAKHGFTNPAQKFNENNAFEYNEIASKESWKATMELLKRKLL